MFLGGVLSSFSRGKIDVFECNSVSFHVKNVPPGSKKR